MRDEDLCLEDIVRACDSITSFVTGLDRATFLGAEYPRSAVAYQLIVIGEAVGLLSDGLKASNPDVEWHRARGLRNVAAHAYFSMDWRVIWDTVVDDLPKLRAQIEAILEAEFGAGEPR